MKIIKLLSGKGLDKSEFDYFFLVPIFLEKIDESADWPAFSEL